MSARRYKSIKLRASEFITSYGIGAIVETVRGSRIIPMPDVMINGFPASVVANNLKNYDITPPYVLDSRERIYRLPSEVELDLPLWRTLVFPTYFICNNDHSNEGSLIFKWNFDRSEKSFDWRKGLPKCPLCGSSERVSASRFVMACSKGHLDDVDWNTAVHGTNSKCPSDEFWWKGTGSMSNIEIKCTKCGRKKTLFDIYKTKLVCTARFPERNDYDRKSEQHYASVVHRQASNLRIPMVYTMFYVPPFVTELHRFLNTTEIQFYILHLIRDEKAKENINFDSFIMGLRGVFPEAQKKAEELENLREKYKYTDEDLKKAIADMSERWQKLSNIGNTEARMEYLYEEEFRGLLEAMNHGYTSDREKEALLFEADPNEKITVGSSVNNRSVLRRSYRVLPVKKLTVIMYQKGYYRFVGIDPNTPSNSQADLVFTGYMDAGNNIWYPGAIFESEGIFITADSDDGIFQENWNSERASKWLEAYNRCTNRKCTEYPEYLFRITSKRTEFHPLFVWWHTLSHMLLREISIFAGYSAAALRERIYANPEKSQAGILIYVNQSGSDGALGGLTDLTRKFEIIMERVASKISSCSNDPACIDSKFSFSTRINGAACYACSFVSETSCEHRNAWLDRGLLIEKPV